MIQSAVNRTVFFIVFTIASFFASSSAIAQSNDSVAQGVIKVRRAPVPSEYKIKLDYQYHPGRVNIFSHYFARRQHETIYSPPDPVTLEPNHNDSNQTLLDSSFIITFYNKQGKPGEEFAWEEWLNQYQHTFEWDDTSGVDSVSFDLVINSRGQMKMKSYAHQGDSSSIALSEHLMPLMKKLWLWYPATTVSDDGRKIRKVDCTVRVHVYATKIGYGQNLPLKIVD